MLVGAGGGAAADGGANTLCERPRRPRVVGDICWNMCGRIATVLAMSAPALSRAAGEVTLP